MPRITHGAYRRNQFRKGGSVPRRSGKYKSKPTPPTTLMPVSSLKIRRARARQYRKGGSVNVGERRLRPFRAAGREFTQRPIIPKFM